MDLAGEMLMLGREPVYVRAAELPPQIAHNITVSEGRVKPRVWPPLQKKGKRRA